MSAGQDTNTCQKPARREPGRSHPTADTPPWRPLLLWAALWVTALLELFIALSGHSGLLWSTPGCGSGVRLVADTVLTQGQGQGQGGGDPTQQFMGIVDRARQWLMWVLTAVVGLIIVFAGLRYAFAGGRIEEIEAAKRTLKAAVTGYLLAVLADSLVAVLRTIAGS